MPETISALLGAVVLAAIIGMVSLRRFLMKVAYRVVQLVVSAGVALSAALSYKPQWLPQDVSLAMENLRPAFAGSEQQFCLVLGSALLLLGLPLIAYLDGARRSDDLTHSVKRLTTVCHQIEKLGSPSTREQAPEAPAPEEVGHALTVLADVSRYVTDRPPSEPSSRLLKDYFSNPHKS